MAIKSLLLTSTGTMNLVVDVVKALIERYNTAKTEYAQSVIDPKASFEQKRLSLLKELTTCQNRILFEVSDPELISRIVPFTLEQGACLFSAVSDTDLSLAEMNLEQIRSVLDRNMELARRRYRARTLVVFFNIAAIGVLGTFCYFFGSEKTVSSEPIPLLGVPWSVVLWSGSEVLCNAVSVQQISRCRNGGPPSVVLYAASHRRANGNCGLFGHQGRRPRLRRLG